ncbi:general substrate transporter [Xylaria sp. FL0064]|nr:general substrate transporter [Xylaria sp. FL0064]
MAKRIAGHRGNSTRSILVGLAISLAGFLYGIDTGIIASTIAHDSFKRYMYGPSMDNASIEGGIVSGYYAGYAVGSGAAAYTMDRISRRWTLLLACFISIIGAILQAAAVNPAMMIVGRALSGSSTGMVYPTAPVYLAELSLAENRGFLVGLKGLMNTLGFLVAGFIGYAGAFAYGDLQWRIPLATQGPPAVLLAILTAFLPYSPRWLAQRERYSDAKKVMYSLHGHRGDDIVEAEFTEMCEQIRLEAGSKKMENFKKLFTRQYIRRTLLACLIVNMQKLSGSNVLQNYQSILYASLGYEGNTVLLIGALYGFSAVIGQIINVFFTADHWTRRKTVISGSYTLAVTLAVLTALSYFYADGVNPAGSRAAVAFIFLFAFAYSFFFNSSQFLPILFSSLHPKLRQVKGFFNRRLEHSTRACAQSARECLGWVLVAEIFPLPLRGIGVGFSVFTQSITAIWLSYAASIAFDNISWRFYFVFIAANLFAGTIYLLYLPETRFLTLEEVAAKFGDEVITREDVKDERAGSPENFNRAERAKATSDHVETLTN